MAAASGQPINLSFRAGHPTALVGASGTGKTTLLKQIAGWIGTDNNGQFVGDGVVMLGAYRRAASHLCLHDAAILSDTVRENLFAPGATEEACWLALAAVELDGRFAEGLDGWISQDMLSLGEAQRLNLARALLNDAPLVLLDEPVEHLDFDQGLRILQAGAGATGQQGGHLLQPRRTRRARNRPHPDRRRPRDRLIPFHPSETRAIGSRDHFVSGQPLSLAVKKALSPGTTASCL